MNEIGRPGIVPSLFQGDRKKQMTKLATVPMPTKEEVIAAVRAEIDPPTPGMMTVKPVEFCAFCRLALGKPAGRLSPADEDMLFQFVSVVWNAIKRWDDPSAAYDNHKPEKLTSSDQLHQAYVHDARMLNRIDRGIRDGAHGVELNRLIMTVLFARD
jgi:hypothetical protein